ncbi:MAG: flagellar M-ring protein FliF [Oscillibacter sp.]|nr:flagellar M-ring protein FliF [Oscillibacter sp.]
MREKLNAFWKKTKEGTRKVSIKVYIIAAVVLVVTAAAIAYFLNSRPYATLVTDISPTEASTVLNLLGEWGMTDYKVENNDTILVPESQVEALKVRLLMENVSMTGHYYSTYFDNISSISTEAERNNAMLIDTAEHLRATIRNMENVREAEVIINPGEDQSYILAQNRKINASASVQVTMKPGTKLTTTQASAIQNLVKNAIAGLEIDNISLMDTIGNSYSGGELGADTDATALKLQLEEETSNRIRTQVVNSLKDMYGEDNFSVAVNCVVEVGNVTEDQTLYWLPEYAENGETGGRGIIGSRLWQWSYVRNGEETVGGPVGTQTNSVLPDTDFPEYVENIPPLDGTEDEASASGQTDYQTNTSQKHIIRTAGYLTDCSIAVTINSDVAGNVDVETIRQHTARAAGIVGPIDEETGQEYLADKISVLAQPFYRAPIVPPEPVLIFGFLEPWILVAAGAGLLLFIIILTTIILLVRRRRKRKLAEEEAENEGSDIDALLAAAGLNQAAPAGADVMTMQSERSMELRKDIRQFASDNPEIAAQMIRSWLRGGEENG